MQDCKDRVNKCAKRITDQSIRLGYWMDWDNSYFTMSEENNYTIWSFLKKCHEKGLVYRGHDVMPWSGRSGSAYSQMEVIEGRKYIASLSLFVKYPLIDPGHEGENLVVWTTTPWTLSFARYALHQPGYALHTPGFFWYDVQGENLRCCKLTSRGADYA